MKSEQSANHSVMSAIAVVRQAWLDAVRDGDVERLGALVSDDVVVVHGNGRCVCGKEALKADFRKGFEAFAMKQSVSSPEVIVRGRWAFEISEVESRLANRSGESTCLHSTTVVALSQESTVRGKVGRVLGFVHAPPALR
ncbi:MAG TPA: DUF4440 domain-containing protein [Terriglobales bacterium]|nr:DUF4440 domain-containing protein [Terriglobales bacterium]